MTERAYFMTKTLDCVGVDILSDALDTLDAGASVFFRGSIGSPWAIAIPESDAVLDLVGRPAGVDAVLMFHAVLQGSPVLHLQTSGETSILEPGDLVLLKLDEPHRMGEGRGGACLTLQGIVGGRDLGHRPMVFDAGPTPGAARLICGGFFLRNTRMHPLLSGLPSVVRVRGEGFDRVSVLLQMLARESESAAMGSRTVVKRLSDLLFIELLRAVIGEPTQGGWLAALGDAVLLKALSALHADPARDWAVPDIARTAGVSTSGLNQRFRAVLGQSPAKYLTSWRMHLAMIHLGDRDLSLTEVAERVGYTSVEAFSRAFKRWVGQSPGRWRST